MNAIYTPDEAAELEMVEINLGFCKFMDKAIPLGIVVVLILVVVASYLKWYAVSTILAGLAVPMFFASHFNNNERERMLKLKDHIHTVAQRRYLSEQGRRLQAFQNHLEGRYEDNITPRSF